MAQRFPSELYVWGNNAYGKLGIGDVTADLEPTKLTFNLPARCVKVICNPRTSGCLTEAGEFFLWGDVCHGTVGLLSHTPQRVLLPPRTQIRSAALGRCHVVALAASGQLYTWGMGLDGRLGHGDQANRDGPTVVQAFEEAGVGITAIAAGCSHSLAGDAQGNLWSWGCALEGALGLGPENLDEAVLNPTMLVRCHPTVCPGTAWLYSRTRWASQGERLSDAWRAS